ncbi:hypothetical protein HOF65_06695 [bacterium]|nr:hypothetical protein [bacterium]MBT3853612.1 hypothetical protein [bacterium]MBT4633081.1 hypothetical protein [bacterium]MBT6778626.1 hypothetical protein [bacterium]
MIKFSVASGFHSIIFFSFSDIISHSIISQLSVCKEYDHLEISTGL